jgi:hypothetical protein
LLSFFLLIGFEVPHVLAEMRDYLVSQDALSQEGIFRLAGDTGELKRLKAQTNKTGRFVAEDGTDVNTVANLLKVWSRRQEFNYNLNIFV